MDHHSQLLNCNTYTQELFCTEKIPEKNFTDKDSRHSGVRRRRSTRTSCCAKKWCRRWDLNPYALRAADFESAASAIPPLRQQSFYLFNILYSAYISSLFSKKQKKLFSNLFTAQKNTSERCLQSSKNPHDLFTVLRKIQKKSKFIHTIIKKSRKDTQRKSEKSENCT